MLQLRKWIPLILLTVAGFTFNTSELTPIGLLSDIACDFSISESRAGLLISVYAWVVALLSLPLMLYCARMDFRKLLLSIVALFFVSHIGSFLATGFWTLMASRIGVACAHSLFWSIAPPMAVAVAAVRRRACACGRIASRPRARAYCRVARHIRCARHTFGPYPSRTVTLLSLNSAFGRE